MLSYAILLWLAKIDVERLNATLLHQALDLDSSGSSSPGIARVGNVVDDN
jgi:hypothetical protein